MAASNVSVWIMSPADPIEHRFENNIASLTLGPPLVNVPIHIHPALLTPEQQVDWLRRLSLAAEDLAEQVELHHGISRAGNTAHKGMRLVPLVRFDGPGGAA